MNDAAGARSLAESAHAGFIATDMRMHAAAAAWRLGELFDGSAGAVKVAAAERELRACGVHNPARMVDLLAP